MHRRSDSSLSEVSRLLAITLLAATACAVEDMEEIGSSTSGAYVALGRAWPDPGNIPVCWETGGWNNAKQWVRAFVEDTYENAKTFETEFTGWGPCTSGSDGIRIKIADDEPHTQGLGRDLDGNVNGMLLNFTFSQWDDSPSCAMPERRKAFCIGFIAAHEFAHALGVDHEQNRPDTPAACPEDPPLSGPYGDTMVGDWDIQSISNGCNPRPANDGILSLGDIDGLALLNPTPQRILNVFYRTPNGHIQQVYRAGAWATADLTAWTGAPLAAGSPTAHDHDGVLHVFYRSPGPGNIQQLTWTPSQGWDYAAQLPTLVPAIGDPVSVGINGYTHVFYRGSDNHLRQMFHNGSQWAPVDLTGSYGAPQMASDPSVYTMANSIHVVYRSADNRIQKFSWDLDVGWARDVPVSTNFAYGTPAVSQIGFIQRIFFMTIGTPGSPASIAELTNFYPTGTAWTRVGLTGKTPASEPTVHSRSRLVNVFYRGTDDKMYEFYFDPANTPPGQTASVWIYTNLSQVTGGPPVLNRPVSVVTGSWQQVFYSSTNGALNMMQGTQNGWTNIALGANVGAPAVMGHVAVAVH